ncbi:MAG: SDR family oxidoreductase, partial [Gemmatimonadaceae bacterium]
DDWARMIDETMTRFGRLDVLANNAGVALAGDEPSDIANGILYLASDESKFVTGSELVIDGGYTAQ